MNPTKPANFKQYVSELPSTTQKILKQIRASILKFIPGAEEVISYGIPAFKLNGRFVIYFAGYKKHIGVYPVPKANKAFEKDFSFYKTSGKGSIQFPLDKPIPFDLINKIVAFRIAENVKKDSIKEMDSKKK